MTSEQINN